MPYTKSAHISRVLNVAFQKLSSVLDWKAMCCVVLVLLMLFSNNAEAKSSKYTLNVSAYSSEVSQTDSTPNITATGSRTRPGVLAVSRNLLGKGDLPYGTRLLAVSQSGCGLNVVGRSFIVEDTMHRRFTWNADIWISSSSSARKFGRCVVTFKKI